MLEIGANGVEAMEMKHTDEIEHYKARVDQIPERPEAAPARALAGDRSEGE